MSQPETVESMDSVERCKTYNVGDTSTSFLSRWEEPFSDETLDSFIERARPSLTSEATTAWICVRHEKRRGLVEKSYEGAGAHDQEMAASLFSNLVETKSVSQESLWNLGRACGWGCGKWMIFATHETVDEIWETIVRRMWAGDLGPTAKVAPGMRPGMMHVICIYCDPYWEPDEVNRILRSLRKAGISRALNFKADIVTMMGINADNPWKVPVSFYTAAANSLIAECKVQFHDSSPAITSDSAEAGHAVEAPTSKRRRTKE